MIGTAHVDEFVAGWRIEMAMLGRSHQSSVIAAATDASPAGPPGITPAPSRALAITRPGDSNAISVGDIRQGGLNDCFLLSAIGVIAMSHPEYIAGMIRVNADGTHTVTLHAPTNGAAAGSLLGLLSPSFRTVTETVTDSFPANAVNGGSSGDAAGGARKIWPQVLEKAVAQLDGGYAAIADGGSPLVAMEELTGQHGRLMFPWQITLSVLRDFSAAGDLVVMNTPAAPGEGLSGNHSYMFAGVSGDGHSAVVRLIDPYGGAARAIPLSRLSKAINLVNIGHL